MITIKYFEKSTIIHITQDHELEFINSKYQIVVDDTRWPHRRLVVRKSPGGYGHLMPKNWIVV